MYNEFPRMLYHSDLGQKVVNSSREMDESIRSGWSVSPSCMSDEELLLLKISVAEKELASMRKSLADLTSDDAIEDLPTPVPPNPTAKKGK